VPPVFPNDIIDSLRSAPYRETLTYYSDPATPRAPVASSEALHQHVEATGDGHHRAAAAAALAAPTVTTDVQRARDLIAEALDAYFDVDKADEALAVFDRLAREAS
jgi:selenocysteine lyase/cysteine desulfurase